MVAALVEELRYGLALILVIALPGAYLFWLLVHPFVAFWRSQGARRTYALFGTLYVALALGLLWMREPLLRADFGTQPVLIGAGTLSIAVALVVAVARHLRLPTRVRFGLPELAPDVHPAELITEGVYAHIRHPTYVEGTLGIFGCALIANYLASYAIFVLSLVALYCIVVLEERELRDRFGAAYDDYCRRVPRFIPRLRRSGDAA